jgi:hypothetical protein
MYTCIYIHTYIHTQQDGEPQEGLKIEFQRLLLRRKDIRVVTIRNDSLIAANWKLVGADEENGFNCDTEFTVSPMSGMLGPGKSEEITIGVHAIEKNEFDKTITLQVCVCICGRVHI